LNLNVLLRGQSNAEILGQLNNAEGVSVLTAEVQRLLGFDGINDTVTLQFAASQPDGRNTVVSGTGLIGDWLTSTTDEGWQPAALEQGLLDYVTGTMTATERADPTIVLWLHNEYDSAIADLTPERWTSAVRADAALVRQAFGRADIPYMFVAPIPYLSGTDAGNQAIRVGMEQLDADPGFNASIGAHANDLDMDALWQGIGGHLDAQDATTIALRAARSLAEAWAEHAKPGSPVALAGGNLADDGPRALQAEFLGAREVAVTVAFDVAAGLAPLDADAAAGTGWTLRTTGGAVLQATGVRIDGSDRLVLSFGADLPATGTLHYGYGIGHLAGQDGGGQGNAIYDSQGIPLWVPAAGLELGGDAPVPGQRQVGTAGDDSLAAGAGGDTLVGGQGNDFLIAGAGVDVFEFAAGDGEDWISGFTPGVDRLSFGAGILSSDLTFIGTPHEGVEGLAVFYSPANPGHFVFLAGVTALQNGDLILAPPPPPAGRSIYGTSGDDKLAATRAGDTLVGGEGNDFLQSGAGRDSFLVRPGAGGDWVHDFTPGEDKLIFTGGITAGDLQTLTLSIEGVPGIAVLYGTQGDFVFLAGLNTLPVSDIEFATGTSATGTPGAENFIAGPGENLFDGAGGTDSVTFAGPIATYELLRAAGSLTITGFEGSTILTGIETLRFADATVPVLDDVLVDAFYYACENPDIVAAGVDARLHYDTYGWREGRDPNAFFDTSGYLATNADVRAAGMNPLDHYVQFGWKEGRDPSAQFDTGLYLALNPDVAAAGVNPLLHWLAYGQAEGRKSMAAVGTVGTDGFDATYYLLANPDVAAAGVNPLAHYTSNGWSEGRDPNAVFDTSAYLQSYGDVAAAGVDPLAHYMAFGWREGRDPSGAFDTDAYLATYADVQAAGVNPLLHYLAFGIAEGRSPFGDGVLG
jgi:hypothetical protein